MLLTSAGVALAIAAAGLALAPRVAAVVVAWLLIAGIAAAAVGLVRRAGRPASPAAVGRHVETAAGTRAGSVVGLLAPAASAGASAELLGLADARAAAVVERAAPVVGRLLDSGTRTSLAMGAGTAALGAALFVASSPGARRAAAFWHPLRAIVDAGAPLRLAVERLTVRRGDSVTVTLQVPAATRAILWTRGPGEPWRPAPVALDSLGYATRRIGPLESDLYLRASSGSRRSGERRVSVTLPAFVAGLELTARYPEYLARPDEPLVPGPDPVAIPEGTVILTSGAASVPLAAAAWRRGDGRARLAVKGTRFSGRLAAPASASGTWLLDLAAADGTPLEGDVPQLRLRVVPDSAPVVTVPIPGRDTTLPLSLKQPLVIDARDDHGLTRLEVVSWRVSQTGKQGAAVRESLDVSGAGERAIVQGALDAEGRGLLPGDTLRLRVEAWDNVPAPGTHMGRSAEIALRLPSLEELRAATRAAARDVAAAADSLAQAERELGTRTQDLAQQRSREAGGTRRPADARDGPLPFQATERAQAVAREQEALQQRVQELSRAVEEVTRAAQAAGLGDTAFQARLREVQELLQRAVTPELAARLRELQEALARLDPEATRRALERLAEAQQQLKAELERSEELFRRAAVEGALASLAADAEALRRGEVGAATRSRQGAVEEGADAVARQIREAAGKHALVSPQLDAALGYAKRQMAAARSQLEESDPNASEAAALADEAVDALNATALALARSRSQVAGGKSGSGFAEAVEQLARLARDQQGLNGLAQGLVPLMGVSGEAMLQRLRALAARQRALAEQLERLQAGGASAAAGPLAQEAKELARQLEAGRLDQQTIERQQRLYRRLLDAGRTLSNDEPDETKERVSRSATGDSVHIPDILKPGATGPGPRLRYPTWEELQGLTLEQRRLVLEYFRRLNEPVSR